MERFTIGDIVKAVGGQPIGADIEGGMRCRPTAVSIDSRTVGEGDLFFALQGERYDGHDFLGDALAKGATAVVVSRPWAQERKETLRAIGMAILVDDTLRALQECARYYRSLFSIPVVAVTGTNGKTTTKDMISAILSRQENGLWTEGNQNNHIGLPLTLLRLRREHRFAVVELGMRAAGEIAHLAALCDPQIGVMTNIGPAHIQFFQSIEEIAEAKGELLDSLDASDTAILNGDDPHVMAQRSRTEARVVTYGLGWGVDVRAGHVRPAPSGNISFEAMDGLDIELKVPGKHMVYNALAALTVGREFGVSAERMREALASFKPQPMRMEVIHVDSLHILNDAYNANPASMRAALQALCDVTEMKRRIAVLGDMLELGEWAPRVHREIGALAGQSDLAYLLTVGELSHFIAEEAMVSGMSRERVHHFARKQEAIAFLHQITRSGDVVLVKGSRKMGLEEVVAGLREKSSPSPQSEEAP
jgi:UDP-N-acetylmuramoyl-tripeptide--D-alanyl-D-alanine ligase